MKPEHIGKKAKCKKCSHDFIMAEAKGAAKATLDIAGVTVIPGQTVLAAAKTALPPQAAEAGRANPLPKAVATPQRAARVTEISTPEPRRAAAPVETAIPAPAPRRASAPVETAIPAPAPLRAAAPVETAIPAPTPRRASVPVETAIPAPEPRRASAPVETAMPAPAPRRASAPVETAIPAPTPRRASAPVETAIPAPRHAVGGQVAHPAVQTSLPVLGAHQAAQTSLPVQAAHQAVPSLPVQGARQVVQTSLPIQGALAVSQPVLRAPVLSPPAPGQVRRTDFPAPAATHLPKEPPSLLRGPVAASVGRPQFTPQSPVRSFNPAADRTFQPQEIFPAIPDQSQQNAAPGRPAAVRVKQAARSQRPAVWDQTQADIKFAVQAGAVERPLKPRPGQLPGPDLAPPVPQAPPKPDYSLAKPSWRALPAAPAAPKPVAEEPLPAPAPVKPTAPSITVLVNEGVPVRAADKASGPFGIINSKIELEGDRPESEFTAEVRPLEFQGESRDELLWVDRESLARLEAPVRPGSDDKPGSLVYSAIGLVPPTFKPWGAEPLLVGPVFFDGRASAKPKKKAAGPAELPPPGLDPPMFPRYTVAPAGLIDPDDIEIYEPEGPGAIRRALSFAYSACKSVFGAAARYSKEQFDKVPRPVLTSSVAALVFGAIVGGWAVTIKDSGEFHQLRENVAEARAALETRRNDKIDSLKSERARLRDEILRAETISRDYPEGSIPKALAVAASEEFKIADTLLLQQVAALESNAQVTVSVKQTTPDPELASTLEAEMERMRLEIAAQDKKAEALADTAKVMADTSVATQMVSLAILNRNHLIAKYGLSSPVPLQYQSSIFTANLDRQLANAADGPDGENADQVVGLLEEMRREMERLRAENELLLNSDSTLYASAVSDLGIGRLASAEEKFLRLVNMFPNSSLVPNAKDGLSKVKVLVAQREAAKKPPVQVAYTAVRHDGGYFKNESYIRLSFRNVSKTMIKKVEFKVLTFDEHGYPVGSKRLSMTNDNILTATMHENIPAGQNDYGVWELSDKVRQVKVKLKEVEFYDAPTWRDEDIDRWVEREGARYLGGKAS